ncbi:MAG: hypothetical protein IKP88_11000 [Lachnospiraceae bacterium]|nr:hypothetical protein [Lachnospiraceae bacterium]
MQIYDSISFFWYDLDGDGYKEFILSGALGIRSVMNTLIYHYNGNDFSYSLVHGYVTGVSKKGFAISDPDYSLDENGQSVYSYECVYKYNDGKPVKKLETYAQGHLDISGDYKSEEIQYYKYSSKKKSIKKSAYNKAYKKYGLLNPCFYEMYNSFLFTAPFKSTKKTNGEIREAYMEALGEI